MTGSLAVAEALNRLADIGERSLNMIVVAFGIVYGTSVLGFVIRFVSGNDHRRQ